MDKKNELREILKKYFYTNVHQITYSPNQYEDYFNYAIQAILALFAEKPTRPPCPVCGKTLCNCLAQWNPKEKPKYEDFNFGSSSICMTTPNPEPQPQGKIEGKIEKISLLPMPYNSKEQQDWWIIDIANKLNEVIEAINKNGGKE